MALHEAVGGAAGAAPQRVGERYDVDAASVRAARRFVEDQIAALGHPDLADDAGLVVSELAVNAVLHARTPFEVVVCTSGDDTASGRVRVEVHDGSPSLPVFAEMPSTAMGGRGMVLVAALASRWGADHLGSGKVVWFELGGEPDDAAGAPEPSADDLLAMWADLDTAPTVVVADVPVAALLAAKEHMDDLIRELQIVMHDPAVVARAASQAPQDVLLARRLDAAVRDFDGARLQVRAQVVRAARAGAATVTLELVLGPDDGEHARRYREVLEEAEHLARSGALLTRSDELGRHALVRNRYLDAIIRQLR